MADRLKHAWSVEDIDADVVAKPNACHVADPKAIELAVDIVGNPQGEDGEGLNWARLSEVARLLGHDRAAPT